MVGLPIPAIGLPITEVLDLDSTPWEQISTISAMGLASAYWSVGDAKKIILNGTIGIIELSNVDIYAYIIGFDHNASIEGYGISFGLFKTAKTSGVDVALSDAKYGTDTNHSGEKCFNMNHWGVAGNEYNTNYGGWKGCDLRYDILGSVDTAPSGYGSEPTTSRTGNDATSTTATNPVANTLMAALPSSLRNVMKPITKYTDNKGNSSNVAANVTASVDYLPLLSEYEIYGARTYANQYEQNSQAQYAYYANGNSKIKNKYNDNSSICMWWNRSPCYNRVYAFSFVANNVANDYHYSSVSMGIAPVFLV